MQAKKRTDQSEVDVYVLGAGASHVHGAPMTDGILPYTFENIKKGSELDQIRQFLKDVFKFESTRNDYPSLVDVLSTVDLALDRKENLAPGYDHNRLQELRRALNYAIFAALEHSLRPRYPRSRDHDDEVTKRMLQKLVLSKAVFVSLNYDVIVDIALADAVSSKGGVQVIPSRFPEPYPNGLDYGIDFANIPKLEPAERVPLLKLHGSFNWLWSRVTGNVHYGGLRKAIGDIYRRPTNSIYLEPLTDLEPILITPTHLKDLRNAHLARIWNRTEGFLRRASHVTFIGYSLPGDDIHIKYLFKRGLASRTHRTPLKITVVDFATGRGVTAVQQNYQRFFGGKVRYYRQGFARFVDEEIG